MNRFQKACGSIAKRPNTALDGIVDNMLDRGLTLDQATTIFERRYVLRKGILTNGHCLSAAARIGVSRNTFTRLLLRLGLPSGLEKTKA